MAQGPLEQLVTTVIRSADALADYPDTGEFVSELTEIAHRWETRGRPSPAEWRKDYRVGRTIETEMMKRLTRHRDAPLGFRRFWRSHRNGELACRAMIAR